VYWTFAAILNPATQLLREILKQRSLDLCPVIC
jgi:hypothetical protein